MSNQDKNALELQDETKAGTGAGSQSDLEKVLQLIGAQVEDSQRRQSQILEQLSDRLEKLEARTQQVSTEASREPPPEAESSESSLEASLARLAQQIAFPEQAAKFEAPADAMREAGEPSSASLAREHEAVVAEVDDAQKQEPVTQSDHAPSAPMDSEPDVLTDNAADRGSQTALGPDTMSDDHATADRARPNHAMREDAPNDMAVAAFETTHDAQPQPMQPSAQDVPPSGPSLAGNPDTPWSDDDAERLMQVCEQEMHAVCEAQPDVQMQPVAPQSEAPQYDREWLDERLAQIAVRVEQALAEMRAEDPVSALRERFAQFQDDMAGALNDVATRADIEALKVAEAEIDDLRSHFERVQDQLQRLDSVEKQLEAVMDRLSDDRLMTLLASNGGSQVDNAELAATVGEYVANRMVSHETHNDNAGDKLAELQTVLTDFMAEQRAGKDHQSGVLDTLQDAMVQVLDRVEALDQPMAPAHVQMPADQGAHEGGYAEQVDENGLAQYAPASQEAHAGEMDENAGAFEADAPELDDTHDDPAAMSSSAVEAVTEVTRRHPGFEPFSQDVGSSMPGSRPPATSTQPAPATPGARDAQEPTIAGSAAGSVPEGDTIARLRQEFMAEARRAKAQADAEAMAAANDPKAKSKGFTVFGYSFGGKSDDEEAAATPVMPAAPFPDAGDSQIFGMPRKKVLIGAFALMIAASGFLLMMPRGPKGPPQARQAPQVQRVIPENLSTQPGAAPAARAPEASNSVVPNDAPQGQAGPHDGAPMEEGAGEEPMGDRSEIIDPWSQKLSSTASPGRPAETRLDGIALQTPTRPVTMRDLSQLQQQQSLAHWSLKLRDAASRATPAALLREFDPQTANPPPAHVASVEKTALHDAPQPATKPASKTSSDLDLPPSTVGPLSLRLAAAKGDPSAEFEVGTRLAAGKGTDQDFKQAVKWYTRSASRGFAQSQYRLGTFYERGLGVKKDVARARVWYRRAAEQGNTKAMHNLAVLSAGRASKAPDYTTAAHWFGRAAAHGLADSQFNLAVLYENGLGVKADLVNAYKFYALAERAGDKDAGKRREAVKSKLSEDDLAKAEALVRGWRPAATDKLVNDAFTAGQAWKSRATSRYAN